MARGWVGAVKWMVRELDGDRYEPGCCYRRSTCRGERNGWGWSAEGNDQRDEEMGRKEAEVALMLNC